MKLNDIYSKYYGTIKESFTKKTSKVSKTDILHKSELNLFKIVSDKILKEGTVDFDDETYAEIDLDIKNWESLNIKRKLNYDGFIFPEGKGYSWKNVTGFGPYKLRLHISDNIPNRISCFMELDKKELFSKTKNNEILNNNYTYEENNDTDFFEDLSKEEQLQIANAIGCFNTNESFTKKISKTNTSELENKSDNIIFEIENNEKFFELLIQIFKEQKFILLSDKESDGLRSYFSGSTKDGEENRVHFYRFKYKMEKILKNLNNVFYYIERNYDNQIVQIILFVPFRQNNDYHHFSLIIEPVYTYRYIGLNVVGNDKIQIRFSIGNELIRNYDIVYDSKGNMNFLRSDRQESNVNFSMFRKLSNAIQKLFGNTESTIDLISQCQNSVPTNIKEYISSAFDGK